MKNETEKSVLLSCGVFCFRIRASYGVTSPFRLTLGRDFCLSGKISGSRNNSEFSHCSSYGKEKSKFFHSEGLKTRGCFVYGEGYPILQKKLNTFFDNTGVFRQVFVLRR